MILSPRRAGEGGAVDDDVIGFAMAEDHRRVEPRGIVGTGMLTDPERLRDVAEETERKKRSWRAPPEKGFGDVLKDAPARAELEDDDTPHKGKHPANAPAEAVLAAAAFLPTEPAGSATAGPAVKDANARLPRVPRDPREAILRRQLATAQKTPRVTSTQQQPDTPPTGSHKKVPT